MKFDVSFSDSKPFDMDFGIFSGGGSYVNIDPTLTVSGAAADAKAVGDALALKTDKILLAYDGEYITNASGEVMTHDAVYNLLMESPSFVVLVYQDRAYHPNFVGSEQIIFSATVVSEGFIQTNRVTLLDSDQITVTYGKAEAVANKTNVINDTNKNSESKYPSIKATADYVDNISSEIRQMVDDISEDIYSDNITPLSTITKASNASVVKSDDAITITSTGSGSYSGSGTQTGYLLGKLEIGAEYEIHAFATVLSGSSPTAMVAVRNSADSILAKTNSITSGSAELTGRFVATGSEAYLFLFTNYGAKSTTSVTYSDVYLKKVRRSAVDLMARIPSITIGIEQVIGMDPLQLQLTADQIDIMSGGAPFVNVDPTQLGMPAAVWQHGTQPDGTSWLVQTGPYWDGEKVLYTESNALAVDEYGIMTRMAPFYAAGEEALEDKYTFPDGGIPESDLSEDVQSKLNSGGVSDVQVNGTSVVTDGIANVPKATYTGSDASIGVLGVVSTNAVSGLNITSGGRIYVVTASENQIKNRARITQKGTGALFPNVVDVIVREGLSAPIADSAGLVDGVYHYPAWTSEQMKTSQERIGIITMTQEEYDLSDYHDPNTFYFIVEE